MASMAAAQQNAGNMSNIYSQGVAATMRIYHELQPSDTVYKRPVDVQKGALMGFFNEASWAEVPPLWKDIELTRTEANLHRILEKIGMKTQPTSTFSTTRYTGWTTSSQLSGR